MKLCIHCTHCRKPPTLPASQSLCGAVDRGANPVDGSALPPWRCDTQRDCIGENWCGPDARFFMDNVGIVVVENGAVNATK